MISDAYRNRSGSDPHGNIRKGIEEKVRVTVRFLRGKQREYEELKVQLEELEREAAELQEAGSEG